MKEWFNVPSDLYIHKSDIDRMEAGNSELGYIRISDDIKDDYELVNKNAFQPITIDNVIDENCFEVVFIFK